MDTNLKFTLPQAKEACRMRGGTLVSEEMGDVREALRAALLESRFVGQSEGFWSSGVREALPGWRWADKTFLSKYDGQKTYSDPLP